MEYLPPLSLVLPLILALPLGARWRRWTDGLIPLAALPALGLLALPTALFAPAGLYGLRLGLDGVNSPFLLLAGLMWTVVGWYAHRERIGDPATIRFRHCWLLAMTGSLGTILALDIWAFGGFFLLAVLATYGLIVHEGSTAARGAGRLYLVMALFGAVMLLEALTAIVEQPDFESGLGSAIHWTLLSEPNWIIGLNLTGFGIAMAVAPWHLWLPSANACLTVAAGAMVNGLILGLGLLGWLRFLPFGHEVATGWDAVCLVMGLVSVFYGAIWGLLQNRPGTVLAYASIGQVGMLAALVGVGLQVPARWPEILVAVQGHALHFGLTVAALWLGADRIARGDRRARWVLLLPALSLAGAPLTGGSLAAVGVAEIFRFGSAGEPATLTGLWRLAMVMNGLLAIRFLYVSWTADRETPTLPTGGRAPWLTLIGLAWVVPWLWAFQQIPEAIPQLLGEECIRVNVATLLVAGVLAAAFWGSWRAEGYRLPLPLDDVVLLVARRMRTWARRRSALPGPRPRRNPNGE